MKQPLDRTKLRLLFFLLPVAGLIFGLLPFLPKTIANFYLRRVKGFYGHLQRLEFSFLKRSITVRDFYLDKIETGTEEQSMFFSVRELKVMFDWRLLWKGALVCEVTSEMPSISLMGTRDAEGKSTTWPQLHAFRVGVPVVISRIELNKGCVEFIDRYSTPLMEIETTNVHIVATNIANISLTNKALPTEVMAKGSISGGTWNATVRIDALAELPAFDMNAEVRDVDMTQLNAFFEAYGKFNVHKGTFKLYTEVAAKDGAFKGYVKPLITDLQLVGPEDKHEGLLHHLWETVLGTAAELFENQNKDQLATKIPFEGSLKDPKANVLYAVMEVFRNAFVQALKPSIDYEIHIGSVKE